MKVLFQKVLLGPLYGGFTFRSVQIGRKLKKIGDKNFFFSCIARTVQFEVEKNIEINVEAVP